jgi:hypothetical protein
MVVGGVLIDRRLLILLFCLVAALVVATVVFLHTGVWDGTQAHHALRASTDIINHR